MSPETKKQLHLQLWNIARDLRGKMDAVIFKNYILGFIFFKYLSEKMNLFADKLLKEDKIDYLKIDDSTENGKELLKVIEEESKDTLGYFIKPNNLFKSISSMPVVSIEQLENTLNNIEASTMGTESEDDFGNLFEDLDLHSSQLGKEIETRQEKITTIMNRLEIIDFEIENNESDILGDAYEYLIGKFASDAGKKAGEFYTPQEVSKVLARIVTTNKNKLLNVYDPTCGSGSLLLRVGKEVDIVSHFYGQESNPTVYNLARMNMIMHDIHFNQFDIKEDDTIEEPQHIDLKFEAIVANPPFSSDWSKNPLFLGDERFSQYGKLPPKDKADFVFLMHMIHHLDETGVIACIMPPGVLFRDNAEKHIREFIIRDKNYIDSVIGLPENIFFGTTTPTVILVLKKNRPVENILFIDASNGFDKEGTKNKLRNEDVNKIIETYRERKVENKYSYLASKEEIHENDYNLNIPRYIDMFEKEKEVDIDEVSVELNEINASLVENDNSISKVCNELNIKPPF